MKSSLLKLLVIWLILGAFLSPGVYTNEVVQTANARQYSEIIIKKLTDVSVTADKEVLFCFYGAASEGDGVYHIQLNVNALLEGGEVADVTADKLSHKLGENVYEVSYESVKSGCPDIQRIRLIAFAMYEPTTGYSVPYNSIPPPGGKDEGVYAVDLKYLPHELVLTGKMVGDKTHIALRFTSKPMPPKKYYLLLWPFAFLLDSFLFPIEWVQIMNFRG